MPVVLVGGTSLLPNTLTAKVRVGGCGDCSRNGFPYPANTSSAMNQSCIRGSLCGWSQVLVEMCPRLLTQRDSNNRLPLHLASIAVSPVPLSLLLAHRPPRSGPPEVNCVDSLLRTPLHYSAAANHLRNAQVRHQTESPGERERVKICGWTAQVLLEAGADRGVVDGEGRTALDYASLLEGGEAMVSLLQTPPTNPPASSESERTLLSPLLRVDLCLPSVARPLTAASGISRGSLHSPSTHSLPPLSGSAPVIQHSDDPSKVCTIF